VAGLLERPALAKEIPALVELGLDVGESLALVLGGRRVLEQLVLFLDQALDVAENLSFFLHVRSCCSL